MDPNQSTSPQSSSTRNAAILAWARFLVPLILALVGAFVAFLRPEYAPLVDHVNRRVIPIVIPMDPVVASPCDPSQPGHEHPVAPAAPAVPTPIPTEPVTAPEEGTPLLVPAFSPTGSLRPSGMRLRAAVMAPGALPRARDGSLCLSTRSRRSEGLSGAPMFPRSPKGSHLLPSTLVAISLRTTWS